MKNLFTKLNKPKSLLSAFLLLSFFSINLLVAQEDPVIEEIVVYGAAVPATRSPGVISYSVHSYGFGPNGYIARNNAISNARATAIRRYGIDNIGKPTSVRIVGPDRARIIRQYYKKNGHVR